MGRDAIAASESAADGPQLAVVGLSKNFGGVQAVEDVAIAVRKGEIVSIIGPNGAGKTSLFNIISGSFPPTSMSLASQISLLPRAKQPWTS